MQPSKKLTIHIIYMLTNKFERTTDCQRMPKVKNSREKLKHFILQNCHRKDQQLNHRDQEKINLLEVAVHCVKDRWTSQTYYFIKGQ